VAVITPTLDALQRAFGVDVGNAGYASKLSEKCRRAGLPVTDEDEALTMCPASNIEQKVARRAGHTGRVFMTGRVLMKLLFSISH
jgi:hypothetical protein